MESGMTGPRFYETRSSPSNADIQSGAQCFSVPDRAPRWYYCLGYLSLRPRSSGNRGGDRIGGEARVGRHEKMSTFDHVVG
jgi:hypothetical protein